MKYAFKFDSHVLEVLRGAGLAFLLRGVGAGLAFLLNVAIGRMLGAEGTGVYFLALSVTSIMLSSPCWAWIILCCVSSHQGVQAATGGR